MTFDPAPRISFGHFPNVSRPYPGTGGHAFLFTRDLPVHVFPYRVGLSEGFGVRLGPGSEAVEGWLARLLDIGEHRERDLTDAFSEGLRQVTGHLAFRGEFYAELMPGGDAGVSPRCSGLAPFAFGPVRRVGRRFVQVVPHEARDAVGRRSVAIPADRVWHLRLPRQLGTPRKHRRMLRRLERLGSPTPKFTMEDGDLGRRSGYDFGAHRRAFDIAVERATRRWGTIPSLQRVKGTSEYYFIYQHLMFAHSLALLREHFVTELHSLLDRCGIDQRITLFGVPKADEIYDAMRRLERGDIGFADAMSVVKLAPEAATR